MDHNSSAEKKKRKGISLDVKIQILDRLKTGQGATSVGKYFGVHEATVRTIKKNEAAIRKSVCSGTKLSVKSSAYTRDVVAEKMEKALAIWIEEKSQKRVPVDGNAIKQTALKMYKQIQLLEPGSSSQLNRKYEFSASTGWMTGFLKRQALHNIKIKGETASADDLAAEKFPQTLLKIIEEGGYTPDQVWNADETGLFWKRMPNRTYVAKSQKAVGGFKVAKDRVTLLFCSNASGDRMLKPLLVNRALKPRSMKGQDFNKLPVHWMANKKAWVTTVIFTEWFNKCFVPEVRRYLNAKCLEFKVLLILDNAPGHPVLEHPNVQFCFLPPNTTSLIQPLDQGIIATFKIHYVKQTFQYVLDKLNDETLTVIDVWKKFTIMDCINHVGLALKALQPATLNACWKSIWTDCIERKNPVTPHTNEFPNIITMAHTIGGEGFDDLSFEDINEMLQDKALSEDDIIEVVLQNLNPTEHSDDDEENPVLNADLLKEGLELATKLGNHFLKHDPDEERAGKFQRELKMLTASYRELYKDHAKTLPQRLITDFAVKFTETSTPKKTGANFDEENTETISISEEQDEDISTDSSDHSISRKRVRRLLSDSDLF